MSFSFWSKAIIIVTGIFFAQISFAEIVSSDDEINEVDNKIYTVDSLYPSRDADEFTVSGKIYNPKTYCDVAVGDNIKFVQNTNPYDCVDAKLFNFRTKAICDVWCDH